MELARIVTPESSIRTLQVWHGAVLPRQTCYIILPYGIYFNREIRAAKRGDILSFWEDEKGEFIRFCRLRLRTAVCNFLVRSIYNTTIETMMRRWERNLIAEGFGKNAISHEECMLVEYLPIIPEAPPKQVSKTKKTVKRK